MAGVKLLQIIKERGPEYHLHQLKVKPSIELSMLEEEYLKCIRFCECSFNVYWRLFRKIAY